MEAVMTGVPAADPVAHFLLALAVIVAVCHLLAAVARRLGQPPVVGEILGGLVLGPSVLARCGRRDRPGC